jgi:hypothetical protein
MRAFGHPREQNYKRWILKNIIPSTTNNTSTARVKSLGKYLGALSAVLTESKNIDGTQRRASGKRKRLHLLYLINDVLFHLKFRLAHPDDSFADAVHDVLPGVFTAAVTPRSKKQLAKLLQLLDIWEQKAFFPSAFISSLRSDVEGIASASGGGEEKAPPAVQGARKTNLLLPPAHGDPSIPFYDLPAGNLLPHIKPNSTEPINPRNIKPVQFASITPSPSLTAAVEDFLVRVDALYKNSTAPKDPDPVGGESEESYYGWSKPFCTKMREKRRRALEKEKEELGRGRRRDYSNSRSRSRSRSRSYSRSLSRSRSASRSRRQKEEDESPPYVPPPPPPAPQQNQSPQQHQMPQMNFQQLQQPFFPQQQGQMGFFPPPPPPPPQQAGGMPMFQFPGFPGVPGFQMPVMGMGWPPAVPAQQQQQQQAPQGQGQQGQKGPGRSVDPRKPWNG